MNFVFFLSLLICIGASRIIWEARKAVATIFEFDAGLRSEDSGRGLLGG
jgi:hypothetical protein